MKPSHLTTIRYGLAGLGLLLWGIPFFFSGWMTPFLSLEPLTVLIVVLPLMGLVLFALSFYQRALWTGLLSLLFILSFFLTFGLGSFFVGP